jgi:FkbM family methyltransferase
VLLDRARRRIANRIAPIVYTPYWRYRYGVIEECGRQAALSSERPVFNDLFANLDSSDVFYDVGAYTGLYTGAMASFLPPGQVVAFEPGEAVAELETYLQRHDLEAIVVPKALSQRAGDGYHSHEDRLGLLGNTDEDGSLPATSAQEIIADGELPFPTVVKIDVFGAELDAVRGLEELLERDECRLVYCELHLPTTFQRKRPDHIFEEYLNEWSFTEIVRVLYRCGFEVDPMFLRDDTHDLFIKAYKPEQS